MHLFGEEKERGGRAGRGGAAAAVSPPAFAPPPPHPLHYLLSFKSPHQITIFRVSDSMQKGLYSTDYSVRRRLTVRCVGLGTLENPKKTRRGSEVQETGLTCIHTSTPSITMSYL